MSSTVTTAVLEAWSRAVATGFGTPARGLRFGSVSAELPPGSYFEGPGFVQPTRDGRSFCWCVPPVTFVRQDNGTVRATKDYQP